MKKIVLFVLFTFLLFPKINLGCSCSAPTSFCEGITNSNNDVLPDIILRGEITKSTSEGKEININQLIYGEINQSKIIIKPSFCTLFYSELEDEKEYVFAITMNNGNFYPIGCAIFFLEIENETVKGKIAPGIESILYKDLENLENCGAFLDLFSLNANIILFPNPTIDEIKIKNTGSKKGLENLELKIYDLIGREIQVYTKVEGLLPEETWIINIQYFPAGLYLIKLSSKHHEMLYKVVKQ